ncbi:MAG: ATP-binding protein [Phycisphaerae bacterium]|nr:ATP-binding protein [Phycisphaerae bacterium]
MRSTTPDRMNQPPQTNTNRSTISLVNSREEIDRAENDVLEALDRARYDEASKFAVRLALEEAIMNAFRHGHKSLPPTEPVRLVYSVSPGEAVIEIEDRGPGFKPEGVPDCTLDQNLELPSGRGIMLMRAFMTSVSYLDRGNRVVMVYRKPDPAEPVGAPTA